MRIVTLSLIISTIFLTGCSNIISGTSTNEYGQICVSKNSKVNLHDLIKKVSQNSNSNYEFENEYNSYETSYTTFKDDRCFSNINDLKSYIDTYTSYSLEINKDRQENNFVKNEGILLNNVSVKDVFEHLNFVNNTKNKYYDDDIVLKNAIKRIYTINDLSKYIRETTPFVLMSNTLGDGTLFYKLAYKENTNLKKEEDIVLNLEKAKKEIESLGKSDLVKKINETIVEVKKFN